MHLNVNRLLSIQSKIKKIFDKKQVKTFEPIIVAVSKTFSVNDITPLIDVGHIHFGENKVKEAELKWNDIKEKNNNIKLHMVGNLQSNKAKRAVKLFDYIHSLDSYKLAEKISKFENELNKKIKIFIQVNLGDETQKTGIRLLLAIALASPPLISSSVRLSSKNFSSNDSSDSAINSISSWCNVSVFDWNSSDTSDSS